MKNFFSHLLKAGLIVALAGCATTIPYEHAGDAVPAAGASRKEYVPSPDRPGLGTSWGEDRESRVDYTSFSRGSRSRPHATGKLFYNDEDGAKAMAKSSGFSWQSGGPTRVGPVSIGLKSASGRYLKSYSSGGNRYFVGEDGDRYKIYLKNHVGNRVEVVVSVDGLDVLDGKKASTSKRGYIIPGNGSLTIDGFRQSEDTVAAFRFGSVRDSYAQQKHGESRNVGVIGLAVYTEHGRDPYRRSSSRDTSIRKGADPFPSSGRFATPPD